MVEIFDYTERVVNMVRPRRVLFMAIGKPHHPLLLLLCLNILQMVLLLGLR